MDRTNYPERLAPLISLLLGFSSRPLDMIISVKENTVFSVFHPDAYDLFNTCSDLKKVAWELWNPTYRLSDKVIWDIPHLTALLTTRSSRTNRYNCSAHSRPCSASVPLRRSRTPSRRWVDVLSSSRRSSTENVCSFTSAATSTFTVPGASFLIVGGSASHIS